MVVCARACCVLVLVFGGAQPQGAKLRLLRALSPDVALRLLALHLVRLALKVRRRGGEGAATR